MKTYRINGSKYPKIINLDLIISITTGEWTDANGKTDYFINFNPIVGNCIQARFSTEEQRDRAFVRLSESNEFNGIGG